MAARSKESPNLVMTGQTIISVVMGQRKASGIMSVELAAAVVVDAVMVVDWGL